MSCWSIEITFVIVSLRANTTKNLLVNVTVTKAPRIVDQVERLNHEEGTNATFMCYVASGELDELTYEWYKDDKRIQVNKNMDNVRIAVPQDNYQSVLRIINLKPSDSAVYSCVAKNNYGQDKISIQLFVKGE